MQQDFNHEPLVNNVASGHTNCPAVNLAFLHISCNDQGLLNLNCFLNCKMQLIIVRFTGVL